MNNLEILYQVSAVIQERRLNPKKGSYATNLFKQGIDSVLKGIGDSAVETIIASKNGNKEDVVYDISNLIYHVAVLMAYEGITWDDVMSELQRKQLTSGDFDDRDQEK